MSHSLKMVLGCLLPFLLLFVLPLLGAGEGVTLLIASVLMMGCHLMMLGGGHGNHQAKSRKIGQGKERIDEHPQR